MRAAINKNICERLYDDWVSIFKKYFKDDVKNTVIINYYDNKILEIVPFQF